MLKGQLARRPFLNRRCFRGTIRMSSTVVGDSGRVYVQDGVLRCHRNDHSLSIFRATSDGESFVVKRVSRPLYDLSLRLVDEFARSRRLRVHSDCNQNERILVYPYFKSTLLALIQDDPNFPGAETQKILRHVGEAIQELHAGEWVHLDVKPDNILVNWTEKNDGSKVVSDTVLGDFDIAFKFEDVKLLHLRHALGNAMWRSPEGQAGRGITKASDIFSFGLVCLYAFGAADFLLLDNHQELVSSGISPTQEMVTRHFCYFGPVPPRLFEYIDDETWAAAFRDSADVAVQAVKDNPGLRFAEWGRQLDPEAYSMIARMTNLDPTARPTIEEVLASLWWHGAVEIPKS